MLPEKRPDGTPIRYGSFLDYIYQTPIPPSLFTKALVACGYSPYAYRQPGAEGDEEQIVWATSLKAVREHFPSGIISHVSMTRDSCALEQDIILVDELDGGTVTRGGVYRAKLQEEG